MKFDASYGVIIVALVLVAYMFVFSGASTADRQAVGNSVKEIYELQYESPAEVLGVDESNGMYKVSIKFKNYAGNETTDEVFVTRDGKLIADRLIVVDTYKHVLSNQKNFSECLFGKGLRILGQANDTATLQQLNVLGVYAYKVYVSCDGTSDAACRNLGVQRYPTTVYNNTGYNNLYSAEFFSQLTGCELPK